MTEGIGCKDPGLNACGGCGAIAGTPGGTCGCNNTYTFACSADKTSVACGDPGANACGGCGTLSAAPGAACGQCGAYACSADKTSVACSDPGLNACGGCGTLPAAPNAACGTCGKEVCGSSKTTVSCSDPGANACGGCGALSAAPGASCGTCGTYVCSADKGSVSCNDPGATNSCPTWCTSEPAPSGIATADYQCLDFDNGLPSSSIWEEGLSGSGTLSRSTTESQSAPASLYATVTGASDVALLAWSDSVSSGAVTMTTLSAAIDPTFAGGPQWVGGGENLLCVQTDGDGVCLAFTNGAMTSFKTSYSGFYIQAGSGGTSVQCPVTNVPLNAWSNVSLVANHGSGAIQLLVNGVNQTTCSMSFAADMDVQLVQIGLIGSIGTTTGSFSTAYDNVQVEVAR